MNKDPPHQKCCIQTAIFKERNFIQRIVLSIY